jgi:hypothetical protein
MVNTGHRIGPAGSGRRAAGHAATMQPMAATEVTIRPATMEDFPALSALWREADAVHAAGGAQPALAAHQLRGAGGGAPPPAGPPRAAGRRTAPGAAGGAALQPTERQRLERWLAGARRAAGDEAAATAWAEGQDMSLEQAVADALEAPLSPS